MTREQIVSVALTIADRDGLDGLTMRKLSSELQVSPPVVYRHFKDKAEIVTGIVELLLAGPAFADAEGMSWRDWIESMFTRTHTELKEHPGVLPLLATTEIFTLHALGVTENALGVLRSAGMDGPAAGRAFRLLMSYTIGQLLMGHQARPAIEALMTRSGQEEFFSQHPNVMAAGGELGRLDEESFLNGLHLLLDSIERELDS